VDKPNLSALGQRFSALGLPPEAITQRFLFINSEAPAYREAGQAWLAQVPRDPAAPA
jgi:hypothetical protein